MPLSPDQAEAYVPEDVELCDVLSEELFDELHHLTRHAISELADLERYSADGRNIVAPFVAFMPESRRKRVDCAEYQCRVRRYLEGADDALRLRVMGAFLGRRLRSPRTGRRAFDIRGVFLDPEVDRDQTMRMMMTQTKDRLEDLGVSVIRLMVGEDEDDVSGELAWLWAEGFLPKGFDERERAHVFQWRPPHEGTYEQRLPPPEAV